MAQDFIDCLSIQCFLHCLHRSFFPTKLGHQVLGVWLMYYIINDNQTQCKQSGLIIVLQYPDDNNDLKLNTCVGYSVWALSGGYLAVQGNRPCCCNFLVLSVAIVFFVVFCFVLLLFLSLHHNYFIGLIFILLFYLLVCLFWLGGGRGAECVLFQQVFLSTSITVDLFFSGFFWLLSLLLSSLLWYAVVPLRDKLVFGLVFSVLFQEMFRFLFYKLLRLVSVQNVHKCHSHPQMSGGYFVHDHVCVCF